MPRVGVRRNAAGAAAGGGCGRRSGRLGRFSRLGWFRSSAWFSRSGAVEGPGPAFSGRIAWWRRGRTRSRLSGRIEISSRFSIRSTRCSRADSVSLADGSNSRAQTTSSSSRGAVAHAFRPGPCTTSAYRASVADPMRAAWSRIRSNTSAGHPPRRGWRHLEPPAGR